MRARRVVTGLLALWWFLAFTGLAGAQEAPPFEITIDHQQALFQLGGLLPGPVPPRCLVVEVHNGTADLVVVSASVGGDLGPYLSVQIEAGDATDPSTCAGFSGNQVFTGTLTDLGTAHADPTVGLSVPLQQKQRTVLRFSFAVADDNAAQGRSATIRFRFDAQALETAPTTTQVPETTATPTTVVDPPTTVVDSTTTSAPTTVALPTTTVVETTTAAPTRTTRASGGGAPATTAAPPPSTSAPDVVVIEPTPTAEPSLATRAAEAVKTAVKVATKAAGVTARTGVVPGAFSTVVLGFLLFQAKMDRNDPKLMAAPLEPEPDLEFVPRATETPA